MIGMAYWMLSIASSVGVLVVSAAARGTDLRMAYVHMAMAAGMAIIFALMGIKDTQATIASGASRSAVAAAKSRAMGLVWSWGALSLIATYGTGLLKWKEWWHFTIPFILVAGLCLFFSATLKKDDAEGREDETMLKLSSTLAKAQLAGMVITMAGLLIDGKMWRFLTPRFTDWAANNYFFFGAMALAALSWHAISAAAQAQGKSSGTATKAVA